MDISYVRYLAPILKGLGFDAEKVTAKIVEMAATLKKISDDFDEVKSRLDRIEAGMKGSEIHDGRNNGHDRTASIGRDAIG